MHVKLSGSEGPLLAATPLEGTAPSGFTQSALCWETLSPQTQGKIKRNKVRVLNICHIMNFQTYFFLKGPWGYVQYDHSKIGDQCRLLSCSVYCFTSSVCPKYWQILYIDMIVCAGSWWWRELNAPNEKVIVISVQGKRCFRGVKYFAHQKEKQQHTNATQHEASSTAKLAAMFFYFLFFSPFTGKLQEGCLHWNATGFELFQMK